MRKSKAIKKTKNCSKYIKNWLEKRITYSHVNLLNDLRLEPNDWRNYLPMDEDTYIELLTLVVHYIKKQDVMRKAITSHDKLRFLVTGRNMQDLKYSVAISPKSLDKKIPAIYKVLWNEYLKINLLIIILT